MKILKFSNHKSTEPEGLSTWLFSWGLRIEPKNLPILNDQAPPWVVRQSPDISGTLRRGVVKMTDKKFYISADSSCDWATEWNVLN